jgi:phosphatidylserine/phosphatidylglycerophosphate/cardiolipin synthase-like enzyme
MNWQSDTRLYDQNDYYGAFIKDIKTARTRVIIESPFITMRRVNQLAPILEKLIKRGVIVIINTKPFEEHNPMLYDQVVDAVGKMQNMGIAVYMTVGHHRKLAIIDNDILWEGSLNILSQNDSCEIMRRIESLEAIKQLLKFINLDRIYEQ